MLLLVSSSLFAQIPDGYYDPAQGKTGAALKTALFNIIKNHTDNGYSALYTIYRTSDNIKINGVDKVYDMYSIKANGTANYYFTHGTNQCGSYSNEGDCYNREHSMPQSWFNEASPMRNDAHHVIPSDGKVNGMRSNYPHANVGSATWTSTNGSKLGTSSTAGYSGTVFEPIDEYKGDFARIYFYMATRYEDKIGSWAGNGTAGTVLAGNSYPVYKSWYVALLLQWHQQDPVSNKEIVRNNAIYAKQNNRNPFIDNPNYADMIWGSGTTAPTFTSTPITNAQVGSAYTYNITVTGQQGATFTIAAPTLPDWLSLTQTGNGKATLSGTPTSAGSFPVVLSATSGSSSSLQSFTISVVDVPCTVNFTSTPSTTATVATQYFYSITSSSSTTTPAAITAETKPAWLTLTGGSNGTAILSGTPASEHIGQANIVLKANNGTCATEQAFTIVVADSTSTSTALFTETFENIPASSSTYANRTWTGDNGFIWSATNARTDQTINNRAICLNQAAGTFIQSQELTGGCAKVKFKHQQAFSGSGGVLTAYVNDVVIGTANVTDMVEVDSFVVITSGNFVIKIESNGSVRVKIDDVQWVQASGGVTNHKPVIGNVSYSPTNPQVGEVITVTATITDTDGTVESATLKWGTSQNSFTNTVSMVASGSTYTGTIPAQEAAGTVYFRIIATDNSLESSEFNQFISIVTSNTPPVISNVSHSPQQPNQTNRVTVSADVTDSDGNLLAVNLHWGLSESAMSNIDEMDANGAHHFATIPEQAGNSTVYYKIVAVDVPRDTTTSSTYSYNVSTTGIAFNSNSINVAVQPNPFGSIMSVEGEGCFKLAVVNVLGNVVYTGDFCGKAQIPLAHVPQGVYFIRFQANNQIKVVKAVKQ